MRYSEIFKEARRLHDLGFAIHWLHPRSKRPIESGWTSGPRKTWRQLEETYTPGLNVGVRLGTPSALKRGFLAVVDVDIKSDEKAHRLEALAAVKKLLGEHAPPEVRSGRGKGSRHFYVVTDRPFKTYNPAHSEETVKVKMPSKKPSKAEIKALTEKEIEDGIRLSRAWEVSLYSDGRQVVLPPSVHPDSGELYLWKSHVTKAGDLPLVEFAAPQETLPGADAPDLPGVTRESVKLDGFEVEEVELDWLPISDEVRDAIVGGKGVEDRSGYLMKASSALLSAGLSQNGVLSVLTDPTTFLGACAYEHAQTKSRRKAAEWVYRYTLKKVSDERSPAYAFQTPASEPILLTAEEREEQDEEFLADINWTQRLDRTGNGFLKPTLKNLDLIFTNTIEGNLFVKDLFANRVEYGVDSPWGGVQKSYLEDIDLILVKRWLASQFGLEPSTAAILEATSLISHRCRVHPVREWLSGLKWDGVPRVNTWLKDYCEAQAPEPYLSEVSRKFLLAMVKRVFEPGCQWDYVLVLEGTQGKYKSSVARALAGDKWFMDNLPDLKDKDSMLNLQGKWLIELGELANVKRTDFNMVKAYLVRRTDTVRPHYGRIMADVPRQSVFIGTVNEGQYLKDPTGNRRYWPVKVGKGDVKGLLLVRDQLFAEAVHIYETAGEILMLPPEAEEQATEAQEDRRIDDDETEMREALVDFMASEHAEGFDFDSFRSRDLFYGPNAPWGRWADKNYSNQTASQVLRNMKFERRKVEGQRVWGGLKPGADRGRPSRVCPGNTESDGDFA